MLAARLAPPSMRELMLAGHSASSCDITIPVQDLALDVQALEPSQSRYMKNSCSEGTDTSTLPAPRKLCKKLCDHSCSSDSNTPTSSIENKRAIRQALGLALANEEPAHWSSCAEERQVSAKKVSKLFITSDPEIEK